MFCYGDPLDPWAWRSVQRADHWEKMWCFWAPTEAYASLRREHTNIACEWRIAREVGWKALAYNLPASHGSVEPLLMLRHAIYDHGGPHGVPLMGQGHMVQCRPSYGAYREENSESFGA